MKIVGWLKSRVRRWLLEDGTDMSIECLVTTGKQTDRIKFLVTGTRGLFLVGASPTGQRLLPVESAIDRERWWTLWRRFNRGAKLEWEDGPDTPPKRLGHRLRPS